MITRRFVLSGLVAAPAVIAADKLMPVHSLPKRYATVWGVGHDLEVVEHVVWDQQGALDFWKFNGGIDKFREVTDIVYGFKMPPLPKPATWRINPTPDPLARFRTPERIAGTPFWPAGYTPSTMYTLAEHMGPSARVGIWDPDRAAKDDASPTAFRNRFPYG